MAKMHRVSKSWNLETSSFNQSLKPSPQRRRTIKPTTTAIPQFKTTDHGSPNSMEKLNLSKLKLAGERLKTSGAQMGRTIGSKMKEILAAPTPESKVVDEATSERLDEPNWGLNLRICAMISREEYDGAEIVKAIKKKLTISNNNPAVQMLSLDLLEACTSNCDKVFSEVSSEKVLDEMVKVIEDQKTDHGVRVRAMQLIRGWGESEELEYLPAFRQTYMHLKSQGIPAADPQITPPQHYPIPAEETNQEESSNFIGYGFHQSIEEKKEVLVVARNTLDILSSILDSDVESKSIKDDLTISMYEKCKQILPEIQRVVETTSDDEVMLFDALNLHDELGRVISKYDEVASRQQEQPVNQGDVVQVSNDSTATVTTTEAGRTEKATPEVPHKSTECSKPDRLDDSPEKGSQPSGL